MKFFRIEGFSKIIVSLLFLGKVLFGFFVFLIYTYYYQDRSTADVFKYFDDGNVMFKALLEHPIDYFRMITGIGNNTSQFDMYYGEMKNWSRSYESIIYNDNHTVIRFNAFVRIFSFGYYNVHSVFINFFSFIGLIALYKFFSKYVKNKKKELLFAVFLLPSVLFWGSGVLKEGILFCGLGLFMFYYDRLIKKITFENLIGFFFAIMLLKYTKQYVLLILLPLCIAYFWQQKSEKIHCLAKYLIVIMLFTIVGLNLHYVSPGYNAIQTLVQKQVDFFYLAQSVNSGSLIETELLEPNIFSLVKNMPVAFVKCFFRPFFFESSSPLIIMAGLENLFVLIAVLIAFFFRNKTKINNNLLYFALFFVVMTFTLTGITTPVLGGIVRYKIPAMPFLIMLCVMFYDREKFMKLFKRISIPSSSLD